MDRILNPAAVLGLILSLSGCGDAPTAPGVVEGVDLEALFAPPTAAEIATVRAEWVDRDVSAEAIRTEDSTPTTLDGRPATLRIVSHTVEGVRHYGAILVPDGAGASELPVLVYAHGGDAGTSTVELEYAASQLGGSADRFVWVAPSFRAEPLRSDTATYASAGAASPWDRDVDDALALINVALETTPTADPSRIGVLGLSRGAGVGLLMAVRDPRIDVVVEFFGPTDFFDGYVQEIVEDVLRGHPRDLPGLDVLSARFIEPLKQGRLTIDDVRPELVRRSAVYFAEDLPQVQIHHGTADEIVAVSQAERLAEALRALGREEPEVEVFLYEGGKHNPLGLAGSTSRATEFLERLLKAEAVATGPVSREPLPVHPAAGARS